MIRDEWIDAGESMLTQSRTIGHTDRECARRTILAVEPLIRADLRAKVEALPRQRFLHSSGLVLWVRLDDVLAVFDGGNP